MARVMLEQEEFYPVYQICNEASERLCMYHAVELNDYEKQKYYDAMNAYYEVQGMLADRWEARNEELMDEKFGPKDKLGKRWTIQRQQ